MRDLSNPLALITAALCHEAGTGGRPEGWHRGESYPVDPRLRFACPKGHVAISPAVEEDGTLTQCFAAPGSYVYADFGELDLGLIRE